MEKPSQWHSGAPSDEALATIFASLRTYCVHVLDLLKNPKKHAPFLSEMADLIRRAPPDALQPCLDYTLFPLLLLLDAAVSCRSGDKDESGGNTRKGDAYMRVHAISDAVAEGVLLCLEELLKKCHLGSVNQMVVLLKKLTSGALLSPSEAAEEFRVGIIRCLRAMLLRLQSCSLGTCSCKHISFLPTITSGHASLKYHSEPQECLLAFLQSQDASAAVGHWLSLLLQTAEFEAARGLRGSANLRKEAFITLRMLVAKVGTADALAFFLPGIVSRFTKALFVSKSMISGAAGSPGSIEHAVRGLAEFLMIVLEDGANLSGLEMSSDDITGLPQNKIKSTQSVLEALRQLPVNVQNQPEDISRNSSGINLKEKSHNNSNGARSLYVHRTKEWILETSAHVDKLLSATFPHLCVHPAERVRKGLVDSIRGILTNCSHTLKKSKLMLLECLCVLVCDDSESVSVIAQESLGSLFMLGEKFLKENEVSELFTSLLERLPRVFLGNDEVVAVSHAQRLLALVYYAGPELVVDHLLHSPVKATRFLEFLGLTLNHNLQYAGSFDNLLLSKPLSIGYLLSVAELKAGTRPPNTSLLVDRASSSDIPKISVVQDKELHNTTQNISGDFELPRMPPWFTHIGSKKLYLPLAGILRLAGLSLMTGNRSDLSLSILIDPLLDYFHKLISELRMREYNKEEWQTWYSRSGSGQLLRQTSAAACMLNEIIYGLSTQSIHTFSELFKKMGGQVEEAQGKELTYGDDKPRQFKCVDQAWMVRQGNGAREHIIQCVGSILHEYFSPELWNLPIRDEEADLSLHFLRDTSMLHQVIIDGIGIFNIVLGKDFVYSGFMHSSLYLLLQNLICSNSQIRHASDGVLRLLSTNSGHATVGHLVVANADYVVDSLCRELRHLDLNPHVADVLAAMLSYIGAAHEILPLLEEPMRAISLELEVLGRHQHPHLTIPFLKAMSEITKASRCEALRLPNESELFYAHINTMALRLHNETKEKHMQVSFEVLDSEAERVNLDDVKLQLENWEELLFKLNGMNRYRRMVGSLVGLCLKAATPLLSSMKESVCLLAFDIAEDAIISLAKVEEAYKHEKEAKFAIYKAIKLCSFHDLEEDIDTTDEEPDENRLLPAMNKVWPFLVLCVKNRVSTAVIRRCTTVMSRSVQISGGDFFTRRFHYDGPTIWKLLNTSPFRRKPMPSNDERPLLLPYRANSSSLEGEIAEISSLKVQVAVLDMIAELSSNKRSAPALEAVLKKVSGLVVGIACSSTTGLLEASIKALSGLVRMDPDLVWLLLADVYYSVKNKVVTSPPMGDLPEISRLFPPPSTSKEYLYVQYGGESFGFDVDFSSVEVVFHRMQSAVFA